MTTSYKISIEGSQIDYFSEHDENTINQLETELRQFMSHALEEFFNDRLERFRASGKIGRVNLTKM